MRQFKLGFGMVCCVAAATLLSGCAKEKDCGDCCGADKAVSASMVGEKKSCSSECAKKCSSGEVAPGMVSEKKDCSKSCGAKSADVSPSMVSEKKECSKSCGAKKACTGAAQ